MIKHFNLDCVFSKGNKALLKNCKAGLLKEEVPFAGFRISFPCTGLVSGQVILNISIVFHDQKRRKIVLGPLHLSLRRQCRSSE